MKIPMATEDGKFCFTEGIEKIGDARGLNWSRLPVSMQSREWCCCYW
jgi:hypothetical protein